MNVHIFGQGQGKVSKAKALKIEKIAQTHGASFVTFMDPSSQKPRFWFTCPNKGQPFDMLTEQAVLGEVAGLLK